MLFQANQGSGDAAAGLLVIGAVFLGGLFFYFLPSIVAVASSHPQTAAIVLLNLFLGWTFVGWVIALVWAVMNYDKPAIQTTQQPVVQSPRAADYNYKKI
ncbi:MAG: superinfection immunity protein [Acidobacteria bacterium]|nr:superinfection immunity protein [Acidobacteriota bacterium]